ncbi:AMP-binding protein [Haliscomenobacter hydrossis]|uniref:Long-chain-fatty-acid--CoA ligase n=1 Tax=Haliscomenobacter hydrossis (strain ATCC 27775 / DSM 1100 / LMG 10767 / O) TaxID=760192 RepID=F4KS61_HALH1|nr:AMP-binding protein [Haliscomenobacter hydrossis]AEE52306.1 Long-chain-fatty-acid--CoA ligase [Haliscomenobacter hydrossis DSM 1100]
MANREDNLPDSDKDSGSSPQIIQGFVEQDLRSIISYFYQWEREKGDTPFLRQPYGNTWKTITWREAGDKARRLVTALQQMGLQPGDNVAMVSKNCYHWIITDLALMMGGFVSVPFYPNLTAKELNQVLLASEARVLFVGKLDDWENMKPGVPEGVTLIKFPHYEGNARIEAGLEWDKLVAKNEPIPGSPEPDLHDLFTILFTSGTTGTPKGVMLNHYQPAALIHNEKVNGNLIDFSTDDHRFFSFLPLNHIAERVIVEGASIVTGGTISFGEALHTFVQNLKDTEPTLLMAVPRIWAKFQLGILGRLPEKRLNFLLQIPLVGNLLKRKIIQGLGLNKARVMLTGAAPTPDSVKVFFQKLGINLQEVYAMTENTGGCTLMPLHDIRPGTVGKPMPNVEIKIDSQNQEVLMRAPWVMTGYYKDPERTAQVVENGWLHTGDQGEMTPDGYLKLTGRVSDTFKSTKGKFIIPAPIEWGFAKNSYIEQLCVVGFSIPQPLALAVLSEIGQKTPLEIVKASLAQTLSEVNAELMNHERVKAVVITKEPWAVENGVLTPTLKIRREVLNRKYAERYGVWFERSEPVIWED